MTPPKRPSLLPEAQDTREARKVPSQGRRRGFSIMTLLLLLLLTVALGSITTLLLYRPDVLGLALAEDVAATRVVFEQREDALQRTLNALDSTAQFQAGEVFNNQSTQAALLNLAQVIQQGGTQAALDIGATQTANVQESARQATQSALEFQGTQVEFQRRATQVELEYQGTQAALNREATAALLGFATQAPSAEDFLTQTPPPTLTSIPLFTDRFAGGVAGGLWQFSAVEDWRLASDGVLTAAGLNNWLLSQQSDLTGYILEVQFTPLQGAGQESYNYALLSLPQQPDSPGLALELYYNGEFLQAAGLYRVTRAQVMGAEYLRRQGLQAIQTVQASISLDSDDTLNLRVEVRANRLVAVLNGQLLMDAILEEGPPLPGAVGVYVPTGTRIQRITLLP